MPLIGAGELSSSSLPSTLTLKCPGKVVIPFSAFLSTLFFWVFSCFLVEVGRTSSTLLSEFSSISLTTSDSGAFVNFSSSISFFLISDFLDFLNQDFLTFSVFCSTFSTGISTCSCGTSTISALPEISFVIISSSGNSVFLFRLKNPNNDFFSVVNLCPLLSIFSDSSTTVTAGGVACSSVSTIVSAAWGVKPTERKIDSTDSSCFAFFLSLRDFFGLTCSVWATFWLSFKNSFNSFLSSAILSSIVGCSTFSAKTSFNCFSFLTFAGFVLRTSVSWIKTSSKVFSFLTFTGFSFLAFGILIFVVAKVSPAPTAAGVATSVLFESTKVLSSTSTPSATSFCDSSSFWFSIKTLSGSTKFVTVFVTSATFSVLTMASEIISGSGWFGAVAKISLGSAVSAVDTFSCLNSAKLSVILFVFKLNDSFANLFSALWINDFGSNTTTSSSSRISGAFAFGTLNSFKSTLACFSTTADFWASSCTWGSCSADAVSFTSTVSDFVGTGIFAIVITFAGTVVVDSTVLDSIVLGSSTWAITDAGVSTSAISVFCSVIGSDFSSTTGSCFVSSLYEITKSWDSLISVATALVGVCSVEIWVSWGLVSVSPNSKFSIFEVVSWATFSTFGSSYFISKDSDSFCSGAVNTIVSGSNAATCAALVGSWTSSFWVGSATTLVTATGSFWTSVSTVFDSTSATTFSFWATFSVFWGSVATVSTTTVGSTVFTTSEISTGELLFWFCATFKDWDANICAIETWLSVEIISIGSVDCFKDWASVGTDSVIFSTVFFAASSAAIGLSWAFSAWISGGLGVSATVLLSIETNL